MKIKDLLNIELSTSKMIFELENKLNDVLSKHQAVLEVSSREEKIYLYISFIISFLSISISFIFVSIFAITIIIPIVSIYIAFKIPDMANKLLTVLYFKTDRERRK